MRRPRRAYSRGCMCRQVRCRVRSVSARRRGTLRHLFRLTDFIHGEILCLIAVQLGSLCCDQRQSGDRHDIDEVGRSTSAAALPGSRCKPTTTGRAATKRMKGGGERPNEEEGAPTEAEAGEGGARSGDCGQHSESGGGQSRRGGAQDCAARRSMCDRRVTSTDREQRWSTRAPLPAALPWHRRDGRSGRSNRRVAREGGCGPSDEGYG